MLNPAGIATKGKGYLALIKRACTISQRYGFTTTKMEQALHLFNQILKQFDCGASFALTAVVLERNSHIIAKYLDQNIDFIIHGHTHIDYSQLTFGEQLAHIQQAQQNFVNAGMQTAGFRSPYLSRNSHLNSALKEAGFSYVSNQPIIWDIPDEDAVFVLNRTSYKRAIEFYDPWFANEQPSLPGLRDQFVEIPVSLPDDEMLLDRLSGDSNDMIKRFWQHILRQVHQRGELFTIQLHPERINLCAKGLSAVLAEARTFTPEVWFARLDEIAAWWRARAATTIDVRQIENGSWQLTAIGPPGVTILARGVEILGPSKPWSDDYRQITATSCTFQASCRPFIGVSPVCPQALIDFLRQQGYIVQVNDENQRYSIYLDRTNFVHQDEQSLLFQIEQSDGPLARLGRWPNGARSALCITGDIDALTLWDYGRRLFGK